MNCKFCMKEFEFPKCLIETKKFCSKKCHNHFMTGKPRIISSKGLESFREKMCGENHHKCLKGKTGENHPKWIKDRTMLKRFNDTAKDRRSSAYVIWRMNVWKRDNYKCRIANQDCKGKINAHHILGWIKYPELRYEINNGITLCLAHHPRKRVEEKLLVPKFKELVGVSKE